MLSKVLIANRGEIAVRVIRACRELGIETVAVHSDVDAEALHARLADQAVCIGPAPSPQSYLNVPAIIAAAEISGADAVHPGYGFLSENSEFADTCEQCGLTFVGPRAEDMKQWGAKVPARALATKLGLPLLPGTSVLADADEAVRKAEEIGFPVILKASAGGGGRGMKIIRGADELARLFPQAQSEALAGFGNGDLYLERYVEEPRHIEFQVLSDGEGHARVLGERECSIQRRHQKLLEEAPSVAMTEEMRGDMVATLERAMRESGYRSAGTVEFLLDERGNLSFMEMNTRIQVEHPVTEEVTGVDLIVEQLRIASGEGISFPKDRNIPIRGHSIECRINAEDPETFAPWPGLITEYHPPGGAGVHKSRRSVTSRPGSASTASASAPDSETRGRHHTTYPGGWPSARRRDGRPPARAQE
ncbi:MAG TPA: biotin carboxylase N-terminal domain-containing protein [Sandaracinaceae bacterium LLY-WYZ-13_1]|nr:biotin carboxylase N-terminal domain-containing protein [Sandaracinaceae bacterium LLY-WYZ-13_1]